MPLYSFGFWPLGRPVVSSFFLGGVVLGVVRVDVEVELIRTTNDTSSLEKLVVILFMHGA